MYWHPSFNARKLKYVFKSLTYTLNQNITKMVYYSRYNSLFSYSITTCGVSAKTHIGNWKGAAWYFEGGGNSWTIRRLGCVNYPTGFHTQYYIFWRNKQMPYNPNVLRDNQRKCYVYATRHWKRHSLIMSSIFLYRLFILNLNYVLDSHRYIQ